MLVGSSTLALYTTEDGIEQIWKKQLANPVKFASLSFDSGYISSTANHDRLVKLWRRLAFGPQDVKFDLAYLPHPQTVTQIRWRKPYHVDQTVDNVLYTVAADGVLRIWAATDSHGLSIFQLWGKIDTRDSIVPRPLIPNEKCSDLRVSLIIDFRDFSRVAEHAVQNHQDEGDIKDSAFKRLIEVANRSPDVCVFIDGDGNFSAWGLENIGSKQRKETDIFSIAQIAGSDKKSVIRPTEYAQVVSYCDGVDGRIKVFLNQFDGRVECLEGDLAELFDPWRQTATLEKRMIWTGHSAPIKKIVRNNSGRAAVSRTDGNETIVWKHDTDSVHPILRRSRINVSEHIHRICVIRGGRFVILLHHETICLWDCRRPVSKLLGSLPYRIKGKPLCVLILPEIGRDRAVAHIATVSSEMKGIVWELKLPRHSDYTDIDLKDSEHIREFSTFNLGDADDLAYVLPVDPAGSPPVTSGFLDTFARDVAVSYTHSGLVRSWTAKVDLEKQKVDWLLTCSVETGINQPALASGSSIRKAALVNSDRSELTIWDVRGAQLEYSQTFNGKESIQDLDWTSTPDDQHVLAVGFHHRVLLLAQLRYDYVNKGPAWTVIQEISLRSLTPHPIGDSTWLGGGSLLVGAGNQLFVFDKTITIPASDATALQLPLRRQGQWDLFEVVSRLNGPLPVFHPQFLSQCILAGKTAIVQRILLKLHQTLKYFVEGDSIDDFLGMDVEDFYLTNDNEVSVPRDYLKATLTGLEIHITSCKKRDAFCVC